jgi:hypothetical protein
MQNGRDDWDNNDGLLSTRKPMQSRSPSSRLVTILLATVLVVVGGIYWIWANSPFGLLRGSPPAPAAAMFVPKDAPLLASLLTHPERLQALRQQKTPNSQRREAEEEFGQLQRSLLADTGLSYDRDIKPWLGNEVTFAIASRDVDRNLQNGEQPGYLLALGVKNHKKSREFLDVYWQTQAAAGVKLEFEDYKGVKIVSSQGTPNPLKRWRKTDTLSLKGWASAVIGDRFVLFANVPEVLHQAINRAQAENLNLGSLPAYQQAVERLADRRLGFVFLDLSQLNLQHNQSPQKSPQPKPQTAANDRIAIALAVQKQGLLADSIWLDRSPVTAAAADANPEFTAPPIATLNYIPKQSAWVTAGTNLRQLWQQLSTSDNSFVTGAIAQLISPLEAKWGISLADTIFSWATGEYALAFLPNSEPTHLDWAFVADQSEGTDAALQNLDAIATAQGYTIGAVSLDRQHPIAAWTKLATTEEKQKGKAPKLQVQTEILGVRSTTENYAILASSIEAMDRVLNAPKKGSLLDNRDFAASLEVLPANRNGYLYFNWPDFHQTLEQKLPELRLLELTAKPIFQHLRSLTTHSDRTSGLLKTQIFLTFE